VLQGKPDYEYYAERVAQTLARVTEVFDWDAAALLSGSFQQRLGEPGERPATEGPVGLDTPATEATRSTKPRRTRMLSDFP
jgi:hypothetical protein